MSVLNSVEFKKEILIHLCINYIHIEKRIKNKTTKWKINNYQRNELYLKKIIDQLTKKCKYGSLCFASIFRNVNNIVYRTFTLICVVCFMYLVKLKLIILNIFVLIKVKLIIYFCI